MKEKLIEAFRKEGAENSLFALASIGYGLYFKDLSKKEMNYIMTNREEQRKFFEEYEGWLLTIFDKEINNGK